MTDSSDRWWEYADDRDPLDRWEHANELLRRSGSERHLADRIREHLAKPGMTQQRLARALGDAGCPVPQSAISKIVNPGPHGPRAITVDEALALSKVLDVPLAELLLPPDALSEAEPHGLYSEYDELLERIQELTERAKGVAERFGELTRGSAYWDDFLARPGLVRPPPVGHAGLYQRHQQVVADLQAARGAKR